MLSVLIWDVQPQHAPDLHTDCQEKGAVLLEQLHAKQREITSALSNPRIKYLYSESTHDEVAKAQQKRKSRMITMHIVRIEEYIITKSGIADYE